jgi:hypothetical protein
MDALKQLFQEGGSASRILNSGEWSSLDMEVGKHHVDPLGFLFVSGAHEPPRLGELIAWPCNMTTAGADIT